MNLNDNAENQTFGHVLKHVTLLKKKKKGKKKRRRKRKKKRKSIAAEFNHSGP